MVTTLLTRVGAVTNQKVGNFGDAKDVAGFTFRVRVQLRALGGFHSAAGLRGRVDTNRAKLELLCGDGNVNAPE